MLHITPNVPAWSPERATQIETHLSGFLSQIPTVEESHGCSYEPLGDYKVSFKHSLRERPTHANILQYDPREGLLKGWNGALWASFPTDVRQAISEAFPQASYDHERGVTSHDGFHLWRGIEEALFFQTTRGK